MDSRIFQLCQAAVKATAIALAAFCTSTLFAHGSPATVTVVDGKLTLQGNVDGPSGWADEVLADTDPDAGLISIPGERLFTDFPGFDVTGMIPGTGLFIQPLSMPAPAGSLEQDRVLWHWSNASGVVDIAPNDQTLDLTSADGFGSITIDQSGDAPPALKILDPLASDLGQHRHALLFVLNDSPPAARGAYGFFATLTSPAYETSEPFLLTINHGITFQSFVEAANEINQAAYVLPGDFNTDGVVDPADYNLWRDNLGQSVILPGDLTPGLVTREDYLTWEGQYTALQTSIGLGSEVPEPASWLLVFLSTASVTYANQGIERALRNWTPAF